MTPLLAAAPVGTRFDVGAALADALLTERRFPMLFEAPAAAQHQRQAQREALELKQLAREAAQQVCAQGERGWGWTQGPCGVKKELCQEVTWGGGLNARNISGTRPDPTHRQVELHRKRRTVTEG